MNSGFQDILARICADTLESVRERKKTVSAEALRRTASDSYDEPRGFAAALKASVVDGRCGLIAEIKKASPSGGLIRAEFDPAGIAESYEAAGATCLSVLTNGPYFQGEPDHLRAARAATKLPVLRKDFLLDPWQVYESRVLGADCVLIIMAAVSDPIAIELELVARSLGMDVLVEVHDRHELDRALGLQSSLIGINNRDLRSLRTDLQVTIDLAPFVPPDRLLITESGIRTRDDVHTVGSVGAQCLLVGESLLRQTDLVAAVHELLGTCASP